MEPVYQAKVNSSSGGTVSTETYSSCSCSARSASLQMKVETKWQNQHLVRFSLSSQEETRYSWADLGSCQTFWRCSELQPELLLNVSLFRLSLLRRQKPSDAASEFMLSRNFSGIQLHDWKIPLFSTLSLKPHHYIKAKWDDGTRRIRPRQSDRTLMPSVIRRLALTGGKSESIPARISEKSFHSPFVLVTKVQSHPVCVSLTSTRTKWSFYQLVSWPFSGAAVIGRGNEWIIFSGINVSGHVHVLIITTALAFGS